MKTIKINLYKFDELSEEAQENAVSKLYDINVGHDWWESIYEDAKRIDLEIEGFELDRNKHCSGRVMQYGLETADLIIKEHGESCETYSIAKQFLSTWKELVSKYSDGKKLDEVTEENRHEFDQEADEIEREFEIDLLEEYANMLQNESEFLVSDEAIKETIRANEYDFTEDGELY